MRLTQNTHMGKFSGEATPLPGNPDFVVSHGVFRMDGQGGSGKFACQLREQQLRELGYSVVMATVDSKNAKQINILQSRGWQQVGPFKSRRSGNSLFIFAKQL